MPTTTDDQPDAPASTRRRALLITLFSISAVVLVLDQVSKAWAISSLVEGERRDLVGDLLGLQLVFNPGAALSIATGMTWLLTIVAAAVIVVVVRASRRIGSRAWAVALGLLLGGALGNLVDRLVREPGIARGHVVDFIAYADWFVGNVADIAIVSAAVLVVILAARGVHIDGTRDGQQQPETDDESATDPADLDQDAAAPTAATAVAPPTSTEQNA
ncbi:signal peptidase II [Cellulomonas xylanilytica]|uniref:Lipoprotein signal peptidase n=1 Tax=Cellulomonas xylanilytica TaxID=233583 RepID=A0A510V5L8_9CELL|nr:signal peptidase II [Cellulomonas xylanilytica]GEK20610.1 lipoprotein signal peptidase [Cellulomonas xylanilytica]